jgi:hypothetical protein
MRLIVLMRTSSTMYELTTLLRGPRLSLGLVCQLAEELEYAQPIAGSTSSEATA